MTVLFDDQIYRLQRFGGISRYFNELMKMEGITVEKYQWEPPAMATDPLSRGMRFAKRKIGLGDTKGQDREADLARMIAAGEYSIFHPTYYDPYFLDLVRRPFVLTVYDMIHEVYREYFQPDDSTTHNKRRLCEKAAAILAISVNTKNDLVDILGVPPEKVHAIPLASDFDKVKAVKPAGTEGVENYILFVGNRWGYKNFYYSAIALSALLKQDRHLQLLCTGHPFTPEEMRFFSDLGIISQVKHLYLHDDQELAWAYRNAALFIFPSLYEGFGFPLLEAFACDCPVISSTGGSLKEVAGNGAFFFDPKDGKAIRDAAARTLYDPQARQTLIANGRAMFGRYSWDRCREQTAAVYAMVNTQS